MKKLRGVLIAAVLLSGVAAGALAQGVPLLDAEEFEARVDEFMEAGGAHERADAASLSLELEEELPPTDSVFWQHGRLNPFAKALMLIEVADGPLERFRAHFTVERLQLDTGGSPLPAVLLQVDRYNLGPAIREELVESVGEENTGTPEEFGVGPDVSWRFLISVVQGNSSDVQRAARLELSADAGGADCFGGPCDSLDSALPEDIVWQEEAPAELAPAEGIRELLPDLPFHVQQLELAESAGWLDAFTAEHAGLELGLDVNLGQDYMSRLTIHNSGCADDAVGGSWHQLTGWPGGEAESGEQYYREAFECQRGEDRFAPAGAFCP